MMRQTDKKCVYIGMESRCEKENCHSCPVSANDKDGRQSLLDEICADYRNLYRLKNHDVALDAILALQKEIYHFDAVEWTVDELKEAMSPLITGRDWSKRSDRRKLIWADLVASLHEIRSNSNSK